MNILFVCSANKDRSKTAEDLFAPLYPELAFDSAGTNHKLCRQYGTNELTQELLDWADYILVMELKHHDWIKTFSKLKLNQKIRVLSIQDIYVYGDKNLKEILKQKVEPFLKTLVNE